MATRNSQFTVHPAIGGHPLGGLNASADPTTLEPGELTVADNIEYLESAQRKKRLGTARYNPTAIISTGSPVRAIADFWRLGDTLTPEQRFVSVISASIYRSTGNGAWTAITSASSFGSTSNTTTNITIAGGYSVFSDGSSRPAKWDQTTLSELSTGSPIFTAGTYHLRRLFMVGNSTAPSRVDFTAAGNITDSTGADAGNFQVNDGDGDAVLGISQTFHKRVYIFKGAQKGSVWELSGATPSNFTLEMVADGAPILNHRSVITTPTDIYWLSRYGIHSLSATEKYGDTEAAFLSLPIQKVFRQELNVQRLNEAWGFYEPTRNIVGWWVIPAGQTTIQWALVYNYALSNPAPGGKKFWSLWKISGTNPVSGAVMITPAAQSVGVLQPRLYLGGNDGFVYAGDQTTLTDVATSSGGGSAYTATIRTPIQIAFEDSPQTREKGFVGIVTYFAPKGDYSADLTVTVDRRNQTGTVSMAGGGSQLG